MEQTQYLTVQEAAQALDLSEATVRAAVLDGRLSASVIYGRKVISQSDLEAYKQRARPDGVKRVGRPRRSTPAGRQPLAVGELTTQAALAGPISEIWDTPEEDEAWKHLAAHE